MEFLTWFMLLFVRQAVVVFCVGTIVLLILRHVRSPAVHRFACAALLLQGVLFFQWPALEISGWVFPQEAKSSLADSTAESTPRFDTYNQIHIAANPNVVASQPVRFAAAVQFASHITHSASTWFFAIWLTGVLVILVWAVVSYLTFNKRLTVIPSQNCELISEWHAVLRSVGKQRVPLMVSEDVGPAVAHRLTGTVLIVPCGFLESLSKKMRQAVFVHEAQHLKRRDLEWSLAIRLLLLIQWLNPVAWLLARRFDEAAEWACDEACRKQLPNATIDFAETVLANFHTRLSPLPQLASGMAGHNLTTRIRRLLSHTQEESLMKRAVVFFVIGLFTVVSIGETWTPAIAQEVVRVVSKPAEQTRPTHKVTIEKLTAKQLIERAIENQAYKPTKPNGNQLTIAANGVRLVKFPSRVRSVTGFDGLTMDVNPLSPALLEISGKKQGQTSMSVKDENGKTWAFTVDVQQPNKPPKAFPHPQPVGQRLELVEKYAKAVPAKTANPIASQKQGNKQNAPVIKWDITICDLPADDLVKFSKAKPGSTKKSKMRNVSVTSKGQVGAGSPTVHDQSIVVMRTKPTAAALLEEAKRLKIDLQILSSPKITTCENQPGQMLMGGEFPIVVPVGKRTQAVEFRPFGISIKCTGKLVEGNRIRTDLRFEFSDRDFSSSVTVNEVTIPGLTTRRVNSHFTVDENSTVRLATPPTSKDRVNLIYITPSSLRKPAAD